MIINATIRKKTSIEINKALNKIKIIVFKSDALGDLVYFSPILKIIKDNNKNSNVTLVCSKYNYQIAKNDELDRWIPLVSNYKRINFDKIDNNYLKDFKI